MYLLIILLNINLNSSVLPGTCNELLPELTSYIDFLEETGDILVTKKEIKTANKIYDFLSIRKLYQQKAKNYSNPIDLIIKDFLCKSAANNQLSSSDDALHKNIKTNIKIFLDKAKKEYKKNKNEIEEENKKKQRINANKEKINKLKKDSYKRLEKELK